jgi:predicted GNAT superfamily acetyltransferase
MNVIIREGQLDDVLQLLQRIEEFSNLPDAVAIRHRIGTTDHLILTAYIDDEVIGCKAGYARDGKFYSWLGAVDARYRTHGIANALADYQEHWAREHGFTRLWMKTRNCFPAMLLMAHRRGFRITHIEPRADLSQNRIILEKAL